MEENKKLRDVQMNFMLRIDFFQQPFPTATKALKPK